MVRGEHGSWKILRDGQDIPDVTLVCGDEDGCLHLQMHLKLNLYTSYYTLNTVHCTPYI